MDKEEGNGTGTEEPPGSRISNQTPQLDKKGLTIKRGALPDPEIRPKV